ncbi:hypothetical protein N0K08_02015 [Acidovorax sp. Be4]|uniref:FimV N-terminal domain-containing protein n=1 Tax=Acidovorax bellezanensis TaxID=2976702 RepID=A0ABT2PHX0_9BURK|nr:FimV/HubP family polar landmark protein [Acidovorax sp. Be4]MCT9809401.1 hypothetical protein [Acidovorax sp. Be4]
MHRWKLSALAAAALVSVSLTATDAWALALGRINMQSALGEPLRAEVELPQITAAEADSLQANIATPAVFRAQGMEYSTTASQLKVQLHRRPDGSAVLRLSSAQPINEPFVDLVLNATWGAGQVVRSYTLLLDPPALRRPAPGVTAAPQAAMPAAPAAAAPSPAPAAAATPAPAAARSPASAPAPVAQQAPSARTAAAQTVRAGDTAGRLASAHRPAGVSLDQMLVAMLRANPHAFISGNVNRIKAGAVLQIPDQATAQATPVSEARQIVAAQSHDFNQYRRQLAGAAPMATVETAKRSASGNVEAQVEDKKPSTAAPDKLTLSKGALEASKNADERLAQDKQAQSQSERLAELSRNLTELQQVSGAAATTAAGTPAAGTPAAGTPATPAAAGAAPAAGMEVSTSAAAAPAAAEAAPATPAPAPAPAVASVTQAPPAAAPAPAPVEESGFMDFLGEDPIRPLAGAGLLALLLGYAGYRVAQRRRQQRDLQGDSQLPTDSFFGAGGGQRVDTAHSQFGSGTSMAYSPSQLDTGGEVDAVAEADVYLAYGRDLQAEEILKEALRSQPDRIAVHQKLADIYAKRQDRKAFEAAAQAVLALTQGQGADWRHLAEQGRQLDPGNPLYQNDAHAAPGADSIFPSTQPAADEAALAPVAMAAAAGAAAVGVAGALAASALQDQRTEPSLPPGLDLDLDLDLPGGLADQASAVTAPQSLPQHSPNDIDFEAIEPTWKLPASTDAEAEAEAAPEALAADFPAISPELPELAAPSDDTSATQARQDPPTAPADAPAQPPAADAPWSGQAMEFSLDSDAAPAPVAPAEPAIPAPAAAPEVAPAAAPAFDSLEFDLSNLSLDLGDTPPASLSQSSQAAAEDPLATKLALAQEFAAIGDSEGARTLIEEVVEEAHGELKARAQRLLSEID